MINFTKISILFFTFFLFNQFLWSGDIINKTLAVIENETITSIDLENALNLKYNKKRKIRNKRKVVFYELIEETLVKIIVKEKTIIITDKKIDNFIKEKMRESKISNLKTFEKTVKKEFGFDLEAYKEFLKKQFFKEEVSRLNIFVPRPKEVSVKKWYRKNKKRIGKFYKYRLIRKKFSGTKNEYKVSLLLEKAHNLAQKNFSRAASKYSDHPTRKKGGRMPYSRIDEIAREDVEIAIILQNTPDGEISPVSRHPNKNFYFFVKVENSRWVSYKEAKSLIEKILFVEKKNSLFEKWLQQEIKRRVKIYANF